MEISKEEIEQIIKDEIAKSDDEKWNTVKFIKGWINHKFLAFIIVTWMINKIIFGKVLNLESNERITVIIVWGIVIVVFILGKAIDNAIYNAKISAEFKAGASINKDIKTEEKEK